MGDIKKFKQGVTAHLINEKIDLGFMILKKRLKFFKMIV